MILSLCVNDKNNRFTGKISGISIDGSSTFTDKTDKWYCDFFVLKEIKCSCEIHDVSNKKLKIGSIEFRFDKTRTSPASWCWEDFIISRTNMAQVLRYLKGIKAIDIDSAIDEFEKLWNRETPILGSDLRELEVKT